MRETVAFSEPFRGGRGMVFFSQDGQDTAFFWILSPWSGLTLLWDGYISIMKIIVDDSCPVSPYHSLSRPPLLVET